MRVLVVDDIAVNRKLLRVVLTGGGHEGVEAADGVEALEKLGGGGFDAVISDVLMARMDGYRLASEIRRSEALCALPVILYSSTYFSVEDDQVALRAGADRFIRKPASADVILGALAQLEHEKRPPKSPIRLTQELAVLKEYNEELVRKLEARNLELEATRERLATSNEALRLSAESFRRAFFATPVATCLTDLETGRFLDVNNSFLRLLGYRREELLGRTSLELDMWVDTAERERMVAAVAASEPYLEQEVRLRTQSGEVLQLLDSVDHVQVGNEMVLLSTFYDVTERRRAEAALRESEERYRALFDRNPFPMWVYDPDTLAFLEVNAAATEHYGYSQEEFLAMTLKDIRPPEDVPRLMGVDRSLPHRAHLGVWRHLKRDGTVIEVDVYTHQFGWRGNPLRVAILQDVTERRRLEEQFRQVQKMEAIGRLTGGIAHDFNNLLTPILGYSDDLARQLGEGHAFHTEAVEIRKAAERAAALTRQLLAFSRQQVMSPEVLDLNAIVKDMERLLRRVLGENLELVAVIDPGLGRIRADPGQIEQVIMNLAVNARDAMPAGGRLTIETRNVELDEDYVRKHIVVRPGPYVMLAISDTGTGMDEVTKSRIFEPFFTTKEPGKGTGLGLATVYGIVKQSGGNLWLYSELGHGTTFKIYLPRVVAPLAKATPEAETRLGGDETVLVTEDDNAVRLLTQRALERYGYTVLAASGGAQALEIAAGHAGPIHILVTDMLMAGMNGLELATAMRAVVPGIKVLFMSGYSENAMAGSGNFPGKAALLEKPFTAEALARKLRQALGQ
jgi:two-component system cell cycle sensor histidine kinase/response regulator CckA